MEARRLIGLVANLAGTRPIFHSEADFQHALAWEIHSLFSTWRVRLEVPVRTTTDSIYLDVLVSSADQEIALELKYKTRRLALNLGEEVFMLADHGAQDIGRYDFFRDIARTESFANSAPHRLGFAVFLTNDTAYWKTPGRPESNYSQFAMNEGRKVHGRLGWGHQTGAGTMRGREDAIDLQGQYELRWNDYSVVTSDRYGTFKFLCIAADPYQGHGKP